MKGLSNKANAKLLDPWGRMRRGLLARLWPQQCFVCGGRAGLTVVCQACEDMLPWHDSPSCPVCALPVPDGQTCGRCLKRPPHFDATLAAFEYEHPVREMIMALKFGAAFTVSDMLISALLAVASEADDLSADIIVPMPLHRQRMAERGFNQSMELARGVGRALDLPVRAQLLVRDADTRHQAGMPLRQRIKNVRGAFRCVESIAGKRVLVIDDVMTSGATLNELARTLKLAGAAQVSNLVVARTLRSK
ncbi:ComF family protein [Uliginosibacterium sp. H3]|uniref:ComF family protein n=1 Tax=Uliginosibacterium silvisoli TaxID=3114758 RepID=A0ABU6K6B5_9RHOO|nr:ComF family protein [Uliginosibacterium sp. H3]